MSLYLKYRPRSFADVIGQEHIVTTLEHAVERDQLVHAYLFFGPRGTGKTSVARILAKILLIRGISDEEEQKRIIRNVDDGILVDLIEIDAASNRGIDDIRDLIEKIQFSPVTSAAKIYIIDEVHMMTKEAFNALLKTLEEPPPYAYFILATTELHKVPDTIQSRCQRFPFHHITDDDVVRCLQNIADKERIKVDRPALRAIARHVNGGMRDAISLLDQLSSLEKITEEDVRLRIGESAEEYVDRLWEMIDAGDRLQALDLVSALQEKGVTLEVFLRQLLTRARRDLHDRIAKKEDMDEALKRIDAVFQALKDIRVSPVPCVALEVAIVLMCEGGGRGERGERGEKESKTSSKGTDMAKEKTKTKEETVIEKESPKSGTFTAKELTREALLASWKAILSGIPTASTRMSLKDAQIESVDDGTIVFGFSSNFHCTKVQASAASMEVESSIRSIFQQPVRIECVMRAQEQSLSEASGGEPQEVNVVDAVAEIFGK